MATYLSGAQDHTMYPIGAGGMFIMVPRQADRTYADGDIIKGPNLERDLKICDAIVANEELDTNASPTATGKLRVTDGTTTVNIVAVTAASLGTAGAITRITEEPAVGYVIPTRGFRLEFVFDAAFATAAAGVIVFGVLVSPQMFGAESPLAPAG
jgi:hypothetical protein